MLKVPLMTARFFIILAVGGEYIDSMTEAGMLLLGTSNWSSESVLNCRNCLVKLTSATHDYGLCGPPCCDECVRRGGGCVPARLGRQWDWVGWASIVKKSLCMGLGLKFEII